MFYKKNNIKIYYYLSYSIVSFVMETENITTDVVEETPVQTHDETPVETLVETPVETPLETPEKKTIVLTDVEVNNSNIAFNVIVSFLTVAQKRGTFSINESAKIWECLKFFLTPEQLAGIKQ